MENESSIMEKIVIATDSFKGSLTSQQAGNAIAEGIRMASPNTITKVVPVADGGEGTVGTLSSSLFHINVHDPLGRQTDAEYGITKDNTAIIEIAQASGLPLLKPYERNPLITNTYGTGELILDAIIRGCRKFLIGLGGSATNDAGTGALSALGYRFIDKNGHQLRPCGGNLKEIAKIDSSGVIPELHQCQFTIACDVDTPFCGPNGAACVFAPQKGANSDMVQQLDAGMKSFADVVERYCGIQLHDMLGSGAAGGVGGGLKAFLGANLRPGIEMVLDALNFSRIITGCQLVITGEGKMDSQTLKGKTPSGVLKYAAAQHIPVIAFCGRLEDRDALSDAGFAGIYEVNAHGLPQEKAMLPDTAARNLRDTVYRTFSSSGPGCLPVNAHHV